MPKLYDKNGNFYKSEKTLFEKIMEHKKKCYEEAGDDRVRFTTEETKCPASGDGEHRWKYTSREEFTPDGSGGPYPEKICMSCGKKEWSVGNPYKTPVLDTRRDWL